MCLWRNLYGWSVYDLQTMRFYYSTPQRAKGSRSWISEYGVQRCRDQASPPRHLRRSIKQRISLRSGCEVRSTHVGPGSAIDRHSSMRGSVTLMLYRIDRFHCHAIKKCIRNRSLEEAKKMKCYKRLIYKQFVQESWSGLCGQQFLSYLPKRFTHLRRALYGDAVLVYRFGAPIWPSEINKNMRSSLFL